MSLNPPPEHRTLFDRVAELEGRVADLERVQRAMRAPLATADTTASLAPDPEPPAPAAPGTGLSSLAARAAAMRSAAQDPQPSGTQPGAASTAGADTGGASGPALEQRIGGRLFAIAGALVVVIGLGLFMKLAVDQGWLGALPPAVRCALGAGFGAVLLLVGELARRRINAWAATGLFAAGIGAIYLSIYTAHALFALLSPGTAFVLLGLAALLGVGAAARANLAAVAVISLTGGYLAPLLVRSVNPSPLVLPLYLVVLLAGALGLAAWKRGTFRFAAATGWLGTVALGTVWVLSSEPRAPEIALAFLAAAWGLMHAGHALALRGRALEESAYDDTRPAPRRSLSPQAGLSVAASVSASSWAVGLAWWVMHDTAVLPEWLAPAAAVGPCLLLGQALAGGLRVLKDAPRTDSEGFGAVLLVQAGGLLIAALALAISGAAAVVVWLALGVAALLAGLWIGARALRVYGLLLLAIGTARVIVYDLFFTGLAAPFAVKWGVALSWWMVLMFAAAAAWLAAAEITRRALTAPTGTATTDNPPRWWSTLPACWALVGVGLATAAPLSAATEAAALMAVWTGLALVLSLGVARLVPSGVCRWALIPAGLAVAAWLFAFVEGDGLRYLAAMPTAGLHSGTWAGLGLLVAGLMLARRAQGLAGRGALAVLWVFGFFFTSLEAARLGGLLFSPPTAPLAALAVWWMLLAVAAHGLGRARGWPVAGLVALVPAGGALLMWVAAFVAPSAVRLSATMPALGLHAGTWAAAALVAACWWITRRAGHDVRLGAAWVAGLFALYASTLEVVRLAEMAMPTPRAALAAVSIWWGLLGVAGVVLGFVRRSAPMRYAALGLMVVAAGKVLVVDLAGAPPVARIASLVGTGLLMLGVSVIYARVAKRLGQPAEPS